VSITREEVEIMVAGLTRRYNESIARANAANARAAYVAMRMEAIMGAFVWSLNAPWRALADDIRRMK
jgi:hypothetical protein